LITSTLLTLVFIPAMYTIFDDLEGAVKRLLRIFSKPRVFDPAELAILHPDMALGANGHDRRQPTIAARGSIPPD
jgi:hypothetical protein